MSITIKSPKFSFVQVGCNNCQPIILYEQYELNFQLFIDTTSEAECDLVMSTAIENFKLLALQGSNHCSTVDILVNKIFDFAADDGRYFTRLRISPKKVLLFFDNAAYAVTEFVECDDIYQLAIKFIIGSTTYVQPLNNIKRICSTEYTTLIEYSNNENAYGFHYCDVDFKNKIRLPFYLSRPQFNDDESVYIKSDGSHKIHKSNTKKEFEGKTDYFNEINHERLKIALSHDNVTVLSDNYEGGIRKNGNYEIEWLESNIVNEATAKFKAFATPYLVRNNHCEECETYECIAVSFTAPEVLPSASVNNEYSYNITLNGSGPYYFIDEGIPDWMTATIVGNILTLSGTPTEFILEVEVAFSIENCNRSTDFQSYSGTIDVNL